MHIDKYDLRIESVRRELIDKGFVAVTRERQ